MRSREALEIIAKIENGMREGFKKIHQTRSFTVLF
jgi:hypothetical protein